MLQNYGCLLFLSFLLFINTIYTTIYLSTLAVVARPLLIFYIMLTFCKVFLSFENTA